MRDTVDENTSFRISLHVAVPLLASGQENRTIDEISARDSTGTTGGKFLLCGFSPIMDHSYRFTWFGLDRSDPAAIHDAAEEER